MPESFDAPHAGQVGGGEGRNASVEEGPGWGVGKDEEDIAMEAGVKVIGRVGRVGAVSGYHPSNGKHVVPVRAIRAGTRGCKRDGSRQADMPLQ